MSISIGIIAWFVAIFGINTTSDIQHCYTEFWNITSGINAEYHVQIILNHAIICLYYYPQKVCNFHM